MRSALLSHRESKHWANITARKDYQPERTIQEQLYCPQLERRSQPLPGSATTWGLPTRGHCNGTEQGRQNPGLGDNPPQGPAKSHPMAYWNNYIRMRSYKNSTGVLCSPQLSVSNSSILNGLVLDFLGHLLYGRELINYYDQRPSSPREEAHRIPQEKRREAPGSNPDCSSPPLALP